MTEQNPPAPPPDPAPDPVPEKTPAKTGKSRRTWRQRLKVAALVALILLLGLRVAVNLLLPSVMRKVAGAYELNCTYNRLDLSTLGGSAHVWGLTLRPRSGGESIINADYIEGSISPLNLLRGRLVVYRAEADGVEILIDRRSDGSIPLLSALAGPAKSSSAPAPTNRAPKPISLEAPLRVDALRLSHANATLRDHSVSPPFEAMVQTTVRVSDVGSTEQPARFELVLGAEPVVDDLVVRGEAHNTPTSIDADLNVVLRGVHPKPLAAYLVPLGLKPVANNITVRAKMNLKAQVIPNTPDVSAKLSVEGITAEVDGEQWASLNKLSLEATRLNPNTVELGQLLVEGGRAWANRTSAGRLRVAGFELSPIPTSTEPPKPSGGSLPPGFRFALGELAMNDLQASFEDHAVVSGGKLAAKLDSMSVKNLVFDAAHPDEKATIAGHAGVAGVFQQVRFSGTATPFAAKKRLDVNVSADGIKPDALAPYLAMFGLESELQNGHFAMDLSAEVASDPDGRITTDAGIRGIQFTDGRELLPMNEAKVSGLWMDPKTGAIRVASIELSGPTLVATRQKSGSLSAFGMRTRVPTPAAMHPSGVSTDVAPTTSKAQPSTKPAPLVVPRIEIGKFAWKDVKIQFTDELAEGNRSVSAGNAGVEATDFVIDPASTAPGKPGKFRAWISTPKIAEKLAAEGTLTPGQHGLAVDSSVTGSGITAEALAPYLKSFGIVPVLSDGRLNLRAKAAVAMIDGAITSSLDLRDLTYSDGTVELAGIDSLQISLLTLKGSSVDVGEVQIDKPRAKLTRNADGTFLAGGVRLVTAEPATQPVGVESAAAVAMPTTLPSSRPSLRLPPSPMVATLKGLHVKDAAITWTDNAAAKPVHTTLVAGVDLTDVQIGSPDTKPAKINATAHIDGVLDRATVSGELSTSPEVPGANLNIVADGIRAGDLAAYLPDGIVANLKSGHFSGTLDTGISNNPAGGLAGHLLVGDIDFHDGDASLARIGTFKVVVSRFDPDGGAIAVDEISSAGLEADVRLAPDGAIEGGGILLGGKSRPTSQPAIAASQPASSPVIAAASPEMQPFMEIKAMVAEVRKPLALLTIERIDLGVKRVSVSGATGTGAAPISLENFSVRNRGRIEAGGGDAESRPPIALDAGGSISPVVGAFTSNLQTLPLAATPPLSVDLAASDINGKGLTDLFPRLKSNLDGSGLSHGTFRTHLDATVNYGRRGPRDLDLMRGFTLDFDVKPVEFRGEPNGPVLAGLEEIRSDGIKVEPKTGNVRIKAIEITKPMGQVTRDQRGIHAAGFLIPLPAATTPPSKEPAVIVAHVPAPPAAQPAAKSPSVRPTSDIRLDRLTVSGIDFVVRDTTSTPNTVIPLNGLDVDVRDISNQMPFDGKPMRFSVLATSDKVPLPFRKGIAPSGPTTQSAGISNGEMRELFSQVTVNGLVAVKPVADKFVLDGWAKTSVNGFELLGVSGLAKQYKVTIGGGVFDDINDIRFNPSGNIETRNSLVLTNLSVSEPPNGPIQTALKINAPIDVAIGLVTEPDDSITMNLPVPIKNGSVSTEDVILPALGAVAEVLTKAIASAPVKAVAGVGNLLGLGGPQKPVPEQTVVIRFPPGYTEFDAASAQLLQPLIQRMQKESALELQIRHELSAADVSRAAMRANPSLDECRELAQRVRREKADLLSRRAMLAGTARGELGSRPEAQARDTLASLRLVDAQIAQSENALDQLYDMLRPGAERQNDRRTRAASLDIANKRLAAVRGVFNTVKIDQAETRIHQVNPQFAPTNSPDGGHVIITLVPKKK